MIHDTVPRYPILFATQKIFTEGLAGVNVLTSRDFEMWLIDKPVY